MNILGIGVILIILKEVKSKGENMKYKYAELKSDLLMGREVEFYYKDDKYSISNNKEGWYLTKFYSGKDQAFKTVEELLEYGRIDSKKIEEIWEKVKVDTIF